jgi:hypothetical protein
LATVLAQVRARIVRLRGTAVNEQNTKAALITPILRALGWDLEDVDEVCHEYRRLSADNPVDYALLILRTPRLFVEAKPLDANLDDRHWADQILVYAMHAGVEWVVLTNGDEYRIYNSHALVPFEQKLFRAARINDEPAHAAELLDLIARSRVTENWIDTLWKAHFVDRQLKAALDALFAGEPDEALVRLLAKRVSALSRAEIKAGLTRARIHVDFPIETVTGLGNPGGGSETAGAKPPAKGSRRKAPTGGAGMAGAGRLAPLVAAGLLPDAAPVEVRVKGVSRVGQVHNGGIEVNGVWYASPSAASCAVRGVKSWNGWTDWEYRGQTLDQLRRKLPAVAEEASQSS